MNGSWSSLFNTTNGTGSCCFIGWDTFKKGSRYYSLHTTNSFSFVGGVTTIHDNSRCNLPWEGLVIASLLIMGGSPSNRGNSGSKYGNTPICSGGGAANKQTNKRNIMSQLSCHESKLGYQNKNSSWHPLHIWWTWASFRTRPPEKSERGSGLWSGLWQKQNVWKL